MNGGDQNNAVVAVITALATLAAAFGLPKMFEKTLDLFGLRQASEVERRRRADERDEKRDMELDRVREELRKDRDTLRAELKDVRDEARREREKLEREVDVLRTSLAETQVQLTRAMIEYDAKDKLYSQLLEAHGEKKRECDDLKVQLATLRAENTDLRRQLKNGDRPMLPSGDDLA